MNYKGMTLEEAKDTDEVLTVLEMFREKDDNATRQRRFLRGLAAFLTGAEVYSNYKNIQKIKESIQILHEENRRLE